MIDAAATFHRLDRGHGLPPGQHLHTLAESQARSGWRYWAIREDPTEAGMPTLTAPAQHSSAAVDFGPTVISASCSVADHPAPHAGCQCGLRLLPQLGQALRYLAGVRQGWGYDHLPHVVGQVNYWGQVCDGADLPPVLRAEHMRVVGPLLVVSSAGYLAERLADRYDCQVVVSCWDRESYWLEDLAKLAPLVIRGELPDTRVVWTSAPTVPADTPPPEWATKRAPWDEVAPGLWQGGTDEAPTGDTFDVVLSLCAAADPVDVPTVREWPIDDGMGLPDVDDLAEMVGWVREHWQAGRRVLVRCEAGCNRSGLVVAEALKAAGHTPTEALGMVRAARGRMALSNQVFAEYVAGVRRFLPANAAGILFVDTTSATRRYLLLCRAGQTDHAGTWSVPGGSVLRRETAWQGAIRECREEIGAHLPAGLRPVRQHVTDAGDVTYTTFVVEHTPPVILDNAEHVEARWVTAGEALDLPLHPELAKLWDVLTGP